MSRRPTFHKTSKIENDPEAVSGTVIVYGSGFDKVDTQRIERRPRN